MGTIEAAGPSRAAADIRYAAAAPPGGLNSWRQCLGGRWLAPARVVAIGSSTTDGANATSIERRWIERFAKAMQASYNPAGIAGGTLYRVVADTFTVTGTTATVNEGISLRSLQLSAGATLSKTVAGCTGFTVLFAQGPSAGAFTVAIDGGAATTVTPATSGANRHDGTWSSPALATGSHSIVITATGTIMIEAVYAHGGDLTAGVQVYNSGLAQKTSTDYANDTSLAPRVGQLAPGLVIIMLGANDLSSQTPIASYITNLKTIIANYKAALVTAGQPPASYLLVGTYPRLDINPTIPWGSYLTAMAKVAADDPANCVYINISTGYPATNDAAGDPYDVLSSDSIHQTDRGHAVMADLIGSVLGARTSVAASAANVVTTGINPANLSGLVSQFRADSITGLTDGAAVASWAPAAGSETAPAVNATTGQQPLYRTNRVGGQPTVAFTAANSHMLDTGAWTSPKATPNTLFVVGRYTAGNNGNYVAGRTQGTAGYNYLSAQGVVGAGTPAELSASPIPAAGAFHVEAVLYNGASSAIYIDAKTPNKTGSTGLTSPSTSSQPGMHLGSGSGGTSGYLDGDLAEVIFYNRALTTNEINAVLDWLATKYGLPVGS